MIPPIPLDLLPSTASVRVPDDAADRGGAFLEPVTVTNVRFERSANIRHTDYQLQDTTTGVLFVDALQSGGAFEIPAGSKVSVDGGPWMSVSRCRAFEEFSGQVHHWEIELR